VKVLVVDPDEARRAAVGRALRAGGMDVTEAPSGSFALTMLEWNRHDVILSRTRIDDMDGMELCDILRADPATCELRFLLMAEAGEIVPAYTSVGGVDLVLPDGTGASVLAMVVQLMRRDPEPSTSKTVPLAPPSVRPSPPATPPPDAVRPPDGKPGTPVVSPGVAAPFTVKPAPVVAMPPVTMPQHLIDPPVTTTPARAVPRAPAAPATLAVDSTAVNSAPGTAAAPPSPPPSKPAARPATAAVDIPARTFQGSLGVMEMEELVQAIAVGHKTGRLLIVLAGGGGGMIAFQAGRVTHAEFGKRSGTEAFEALVISAHREGTGKFCFIPGDGAALANLPRTISATTEQLLLTIATALDKKG